jgi:DNA-binding CsgD family transcriptional regulator
LTALVSPMRGGAFQQFAHRGPAVVLVRGPERVGAGSEAVLAALFGLTRSEAKLASALVDGMSLDEFAERKSVSTNTVRSQLKSIMRKTETNRQGELISVLCGAQPWRGLRSANQPRSAATRFGVTWDNCISHCQDRAIHDLFAAWIAGYDRSGHEAHVWAFGIESLAYLKQRKTEAEQQHPEKKKVTGPCLQMRLVRRIPGRGCDRQNRCENGERADGQQGAFGNQHLYRVSGVTHSAKLPQ